MINSAQRRGVRKSFTDIQFLRKKFLKTANRDGYSRQKTAYIYDTEIGNTKMYLKNCKTISIPGVEVAVDEVRDVDKAQNIMNLISHVGSLNLVPEKNGQSFEWF